jgi:hypothetical protein
VVLKTRVMGEPVVIDFSESLEPVPPASEAL